MTNSIRGHCLVKTTQHLVLVTIHRQTYLGSAAVFRAARLWSSSSCSRIILAQTCGETPGEALSLNGFYWEICFNQVLKRKKPSSVRYSSLCFSTVVTRIQSFGSKQLFVLCCVSASSLKTSNRAHPIISATEAHWGQALYQIKSDKSHAHAQNCYYNQILAKWYLIVVAIK